MIKPVVIAIHTMIKENLDVLEETFDAVNELDVDFMMNSPVWKIPEEVGKEHEKLMYEELGVRPSVWKSYVGQKGDFPDMEKLNDTKKRIKKKNMNFPYMFMPNVAGESLKKFYTDFTETFGFNRCTNPWFETIVMPNGDIVTCMDHSDVVVGNLKNSGIMEI